MFGQKSLCLLLLVGIISKSELATKQQTISRCCHTNEVGQINGTELICQIVNGVEWHPKIYSRRKGGFLQRPPANWKIIDANRPYCGYYNPSVIKSNQYVLTELGYVFHNDAKVPRDRFCVENDVALICLDDTFHRNGTNDATSSSAVHIKKCCGQNGAYSLTNSSCTLVPNQLNSILSPTLLNTNYSIVQLSGYPVCPNDSVGLNQHGELNGFNLAQDGSLVSVNGGQTVIRAGEYCVEYLLNHQQTLNIFACPNSVVRTAPASDYWHLSIYATGLIISVIFLIATLATGFLLPSSHHVLHWRCQTNYVMCLLIGDLFLAITQLAGHKITGLLCQTIASIMHFFFLAAFFWLNTMCFNIWWTFRDIRPASLEKGQEACRLRLYEVYAWGVPFIIAGIGILFDNLPNDKNNDFLRPHFAEKHCWFSSDMEKFAYFFGPIGVLLTINLILFCLTARELTCGLWKREVVKSNTERAALGRVCLKLVVVMGVSWVADVISWAAGGPQALWYITDVINTLQGLFIFIVIGCQPQVWTALKRLWCLRQSPVSGTIGNGNHHSSSSHGLPSLGDSVTHQTMTNTTNISCKSTTPLETSC